MMTRKIKNHGKNIEKQKMKKKQCWKRFRGEK